MKLFSPAYLVFCAWCRHHAHIVYSNGAVSHEFHTKDDGLRIVRSALAIQQLTAAEATHLEDEIQRSVLLSAEDLFAVAELLLRKFNAGGARYH